MFSTSHSRCPLQSIASNYFKSSKPKLLVVVCARSGNCLSHSWCPQVSSLKSSRSKASSIQALKSPQLQTSCLHASSLQARTRTISTARMMGGGEVSEDIQKVHGEVSLLRTLLTPLLLLTALLTLHIQTGPYSSSSCSGMTARHSG
jgi:hypothetical protein